MLRLLLIQEKDKNNQISIFTEENKEWMMHPIIFNEFEKINKSIDGMNGIQDNTKSNYAYTLDIWFQFLYRNEVRSEKDYGHIEIIQLYKRLGDDFKRRYYKYNN